MKLLDKYLFKELLTPFFIGTVAVALLFDANLMIALEKQLDLSSVPKLALFQFLVYKIPSFLDYTLPVGVTLAAALAITRIARESELTAMRSAGASIRRCIRPILLFGIIVSVGDFFLIENVVPPAEKQANSYERQIGSLVMSPVFIQNASIRLGKYEVSIGTASKTGENKCNLTDLVLFSRPDPGIDEVMTAATGKYDNGEWILDGAIVRQFRGLSLQQFQTLKTFSISNRIVLNDLFEPPPPDNLTIRQLIDSISMAKKTGTNPRTFEVQLNTRFSVPAACLVFAFVAPIFAILFAKSGGFAGILISIFISLLYYNAHVISTDILGKNGSVPPFVAAWLPNFIFIILGFFALRRLE